MRNHFLRAAAGNLGISFLDATANSGDEVTWSSSDITVSTGDHFLLYSFGENLAESGTVVANGTSTFTVANNVGFDVSNEDGDGGNDFLVVLDDLIIYEVTSGGSLRAQGLSGDPVSSGGGVIAFSGVSSLARQVDSARGDEAVFNTVSIASLNKGILLYTQVRQTIDGSAPTGREPSLPSGFTSTGANTYFTSGVGGGIHEWYFVSGYKEVDDGESFSHTVDNISSNSLDLGIAINIYNT